MPVIPKLETETLRLDRRDGTKIAGTLYWYLAIERFGF